VGALLEAAQSRLTEIHGAREDVSAGDRAAQQDGAAQLWGLCSAVDAERSAGDMPRIHARTPESAVSAIVDVFRARRSRVAAFDLAPEPGVSVIKVVAPGLEVSGLL